MKENESNLSGGLAALQSSVATETHVVKGVASPTLQARDALCSVSGNFILTPKGLMSPDRWLLLQHLREKNRIEKRRRIKAGLIRRAQRQREFLFRKDNDLISPDKKASVDTFTGETI